VRRFLLYCLLALAPVRLAAQAPADSNGRLTYHFRQPTKSALAIAMDGLPSLDGEFISIQVQRGDSVAQITARVRDSTWALNPEVWGESPGRRVFFGRLHAYLGGDPRFHILVKPAPCAGCEGEREAVFIRYADKGYLVSGSRRIRPSH
jgi:hypothetical protein